MTAKTNTIFEKMPELEKKNDQIEPPALNAPKTRRGRKHKKQLDRSELMYFYEEERSAEKGKHITRLSDFGFSVLEETPNTKQYYEKYEHLSAKEKENFELKFTKPKNRHQEEYANALKTTSKKIVVCTGPAGTGKTLFATEYGIRQFLTGKVEKLIFTRPSVSVDEDLGYLPGSLEDKMAPWVRPIYDILYAFLSPSEVTALIADKQIEIAPLGFMRGRTFKNAWIVADEMQNSTISQMKMLLTRLGENSRIIVTGDLEQFDRVDDLNGLDDFLSKLKGKRSDSISSFEFDKEDIQREEVVKEVLEIYAAYEMPATYDILPLATERSDSSDSSDGSVI
jgi:phosphate starvation-inducible protein PhoH